MYEKVNGVCNFVFFNYSPVDKIRYPLILLVDEKLSTGYFTSHLIDLLT